MKNKTLCRILDFRMNNNIRECGGWPWSFVIRTLYKRIKHGKREAGKRGTNYPKRKA